MVGLYTDPWAQHSQAMYALSTVYGQLPWTPVMLRNAAAHFKAQHVQPGVGMHVQPNAGSSAAQGCPGDIEMAGPDPIEDQSIFSAATREELQRLAAAKGAAALEA